MYEITLNNNLVGWAQVERIGLYYKFCCICNSSKNKMFRIVVSDGNNTVNLGICVPEGDKFVLTKRIPVKYLSGKRLHFSIENDFKDRISLVNCECFNYLDKLDTAHLRIADGQPYIVIN